MKHLIAFVFLASPVLADTCPPVQDYSKEMARLLDASRNAPDEQTGREVSQRMWRVWLRAPDEIAQELLDRGMGQRNSYDFAGAYESFDRLVTYCPDYAEGYNQRGFVSFLREDYASALVDLDITLGLSPTHVGAQSGRALTLMNLGRTNEARGQMLEALDNNPWLSERALVAEGAPLGPIGEDI